MMDSIQKINASDSAGFKCFGMTADVLKETPDHISR